MFHDDVCDGNGGIDLIDYHPVVEHIRLETPFDFQWNAYVRLVFIRLREGTLTGPKIGKSCAAFKL